MTIFTLNNLTKYKKSGTGSTSNRDIREPIPSRGIFSLDEKNYSKLKQKSNGNSRKEGTFVLENFGPVDKIIPSVGLIIGGVTFNTDHSVSVEKLDTENETIQDSGSILDAPNSSLIYKEESNSFGTKQWELNGVSRGCLIHSGSYAYYIGGSLKGVRRDFNGNVVEATDEISKWGFKMSIQDGTPDTSSIKTLDTSMSSRGIPNGNSASDKNKENGFIFGIENAAEMQDSIEPGTEIHKIDFSNDNFEKLNQNLDKEEVDQSSCEDNERENAYLAGGGVTSDVSRFDINSFSMNSISNLDYSASNIASTYNKDFNYFCGGIPSGSDGQSKLSNLSRLDFSSETIDSSKDLIERISDYSGMGNLEGKSGYIFAGKDRLSGNQFSSNVMKIDFSTETSKFLDSHMKNSAIRRATSSNKQ